MKGIEIYESLLVHDDARDRIIKALRLTVERQREEIAAIRREANKQRIDGRSGDANCLCRSTISRLRKPL